MNVTDRFVIEVTACFAGC